MRKALIFGGAAALVAAIAGCGGGGGGTSSTASRVVVGYVYVSTNLTPTGSPGTIIANTTVPPPGYAVPSAGVIHLHVDNGTITRLAADVDFDMTDPTANAIIAHVTSKSASPSLILTGSGLALGAVSKPSIGAQVYPLAGLKDTVLPITFGIPPTTYVPGAPAAIKVLAMDPSALGSGKFGAPGDIIANIIPSTSSGDAYQFVVIASDANGVVIPGTTATATDPDANATQLAVSESSSAITVAGGGVNDTPVPISFGIQGNTTLSTTFTANYTFGSATSFVSAFTPVGPTSLVWPGVAGPGASQAYTVNITNGRGVAVPTLALQFDRLDTTTTVAANAYPGPATGNALSATTGVTDASGNASVTFSTPAGAVGNPSFNGLAIKGANQLRVSAGSVIGSTTINISRPLGSISIAGPSAVNISSTSPTTGVNAFLVTGASDIDGASVTAPAVTWNLANAASGTIGNTGDSAAPTNAATGSSFLNNQLSTSSTAGQLTITATGGVTSNALTVKVLGLAQRVFLTPDTSVTGTYTGSPALGWYNIATANTNLPGFTVTVLDSGGNDLVANAAATVTLRSITNTSGSTFISGNGTSGSPFIVESGAVDGSFTVQVTGNSSAGIGGVPYSLQKVVGVNIAP
jgi:hypothetical protein